MSGLKVFILRDEKVLDFFLTWLASTWKPAAAKGKPLAIKVVEAKRSTAQNALMWSLLGQLEPIDWYGNHLKAEEWKDVVTASIKQQRVVPGIDGGFVVCGSKTSQMSSQEMNEVIEATYAFGVSKEIIFKEPSEVQFTERTPNPRSSK